MIRVVYRWNVKPELQSEFENTWRETTRTIHQNVAGALGSICLRAIDSSDEMITIATWETEDQWRSFIKEAKQGNMKTLHDIASLIDTAPYFEVGDETVLQE